MRATVFMSSTVTAALSLAACKGGGTTAPSTPPPPTTPSLVISFAENPVPFRSTGCSPIIPEGWHTQARIQETGGVAFTPAALIQKVDGNAVDFLQESFNSRFGACAGGTFTPGTIPANGTVCADVGVCAASGSYNSYQLQITGTDASGRSWTFDSPVLQFGSRSLAGNQPAGTKPVIAWPAAPGGGLPYTAPR